MHSKKVFKKNDYLGRRKIFNWSNGFLLKLFMGALFTKAICTFLKSVQKDECFDAPFDLFKEKKFSSLRRDN